LPNDVCLKNVFSVCKSGPLGTGGSAAAPGPGKIFGGISDGGSTAALAEGEGAAAVAVSLLLDAAGEMVGLGDDWAIAPVADASASPANSHRKNLLAIKLVK